MKQRTKNQHYVPKCLLKHFSKSTRDPKKLNILDIARSSTRYNQSIEKSFSENYFYDKDNSTENLLCRHIESPAAIVINKIVDGQLSISDEDRYSLLKFIVALLFRTPHATEQALSFINSSFESMIAKVLSLNDFDPNEASKGKIQLEDLSKLRSLITLQAIIDGGVLVDLNFHIIKNNTSLDFFISDHPAFAYNWFYKNLEHPMVTSLTARGLQIFMPVSPRLLVCFYDAKVYKYGERKNSDVTIVSDVNDIEILNSFQVINAESMIGFCDEKSEKNLKKIYEKYQKNKIHESKIIKEEQLDDENLKITTITFRRQTKLSRMPSFISIKKNSKKDLSMFGERDSALSELHKIYKKQLFEEKNEIN